MNMLWVVLLIVVAGAAAWWGCNSTGKRAAQTTIGAASPHRAALRQVAQQSQQASQRPRPLPATTPRAAPHAAAASPPTARPVLHGAIARTTRALLLGGDEPLESLELLRTCLANIAAHPEEARFRRINAGGARFRRLVWARRGRDVLQALGFRTVRGQSAAAAPAAAAAAAGAEAGAAPAVVLLLSDVSAERVLALRGVLRDLTQAICDAKEGRRAAAVQAAEAAEAVGRDNGPTADTAARSGGGGGGGGGGGAGGGGGSGGAPGGSSELMCCECGRGDLFRDEYFKPGCFLTRARHDRQAIGCDACGARYVICGSCFNRGTFTHPLGEDGHNLSVLVPEGSSGSSRYEERGGWAGEVDDDGQVTRRPRRPPPPPPGRRPGRGPWG